MICTTCDEPFHPEYPRLCECGHEFGDGFEVEPSEDPHEQIGSRVFAVIVGLVLLVAAVFGYFIFILSGTANGSY